MHTQTLRKGGAALVACVLVFTGCSSGGSSSKGSTAAAITNPNGDFVNVGPLAQPRAYHSATTLKDGRILVAGGLVNTTNATQTVEILDPTTGMVSAAAPMTTARMHHEAVLLPTGKVLVVGGTAQRYTAGHQTTELYDPANDTWTAGPLLSEPRCRPAVALYDQGKKVLIAGGATWNSGVPTVLTSADIYNADANVITPTSNMQSARCCAEGFEQSNGQILLASGYQDFGTAKPAVPEVYDVATATFIPVSMNQNRAETALAQVGNEIYAFGGLDDLSQTLATSELFNGQNWSTTAPISSARAQHTATVNSKAEVVIIGGRVNNTTAQKGMEMFPPLLSSGTMPELNEARYDHTATAIGDTVYVIGGFTDGEQILASIEAYAPAGTAVAGAGAGVGTRSNGQAPPPPTGTVSIATLSPTSGQAGDTVRLTGTGFAPLAHQNVVRFNGLQAVITAINLSNTAANTIDVIVPANVTTGPVSVQIGSTIATGPVFTVGSGTNGKPPRILLVFPKTASQFIPVSITGFNFGPNPVVTFNGLPTINLVNYSTKNLPLIGSISELIVLVPPGATSGPLIVTNGAMQSNPVFFTVR